MTQERLLKLLDQPDQLAFVPYEELKTLALAYPYAHNLRYLMALKAKQDQHPDQKKILATAAAYSLDRTKLFTLFTPYALVPQKTEEVLELKPLDTILRERERLETVQREEILEKKSAENAAAPPLSHLAETPKSAAEEAPKSVLPPTGPPAQATASPLTFSDWIGHFNLPEISPKSLKTSILENKPTPEPPSMKTTAPTQAKTGIAQILAEKSVSENKDVISETLARLLAKQGHTEKAIAMYERLCLAFPDRFATFAAEIDKLKK